MPAPSHWGVTPRQSVHAECGRRGRPGVVEGCIALLDGRPVDAELIIALGGPPARWAVTRQTPGPDHWLRVWAARGLLWAWEPAATPALITALADESWRVREMAARVVARHRVDAALDAVVALQQDPVLRVRTAATRALVRLTETEKHGSPESFR